MRFLEENNYSKAYNKTANPQFENIKVKGRTGTWYVVQVHNHRNGQQYFQLESEVYGDMAEHIIVDTKMVEQNESLSYELLFEY